MAHSIINGLEVIYSSICCDCVVKAVQRLQVEMLLSDIVTDTGSVVDMEV